ncbi:MAG: hypothetical protein U0359_40595 [Byssovorax sp.]
MSPTNSPSPKIARNESASVCAVCGSGETAGARMSRVVIEGRSLELCRTHTATVVAAMPETFDDLRALFVGITPLDAAGPRHVPERRSPIERRAEENRRMFPPRPEGRRRGEGRRASDPRGL